MEFNYDKLLGKMKENGVTQKMLAHRIHNTLATLNQKLNGKGYFRQNEIYETCVYLGISTDDIGVYFFNCKV